VRANPTEKKEKRKRKGSREFGGKVDKGVEESEKPNPAWSQVGEGPPRRLSSEKTSHNKKGKKLKERVEDPGIPRLK